MINVLSDTITSYLYCSNFSYIFTSDRVSNFIFNYPPNLVKEITGKEELEFDEDGDLILNREKEGTLKIGRTYFLNYIFIKL